MSPAVGNGFTPFPHYDSAFQFVFGTLIMSLRICAATEDLHGSLKKAIVEAGQASVDGVRLNARTELENAGLTTSAQRQILLYAREHRLNIAALSCPTRQALFDEEYLEQRIEVIRRSMSIVRNFETDKLIIRVGRIPDPTGQQTPLSDSGISSEDPLGILTPAAQKSESEQYSMLCELLNELTTYGNHVGCTLTLQLANYDLGRIERLLTDVKGGPLQISFDPATAIMTGAAVIPVYRSLYQHVGFVRGRDALRDVDGAGIEVAVGDGIVEWIELLPTLAEADYQGWVSVERTGGDHRNADVVRGVQSIRRLFPSSAL